MFRPATQAISAAVMTQAAATTLEWSEPVALALVVGGGAAGLGGRAMALAAFAGILSALGHGELATALAAAAWATGTTPDLRAAAQAGFVGGALCVLLTWALPAAWTPVAAAGLAQTWAIWAVIDPWVPLSPRGLPAPLRLRLNAALADATAAWALTGDRTGRRLLAEAGAELVALSKADAQLSAVRPTSPDLAGELDRVRERWQRTASVLSRARRAHELGRAMPVAVPEGPSADLARSCEALEAHVRATCTSRREVDHCQLDRAERDHREPDRGA